MSNLKQKIIIVGGGTAGWMTASALARFLPHDRYPITLIESEQIGTVGVGEATIPHIRQFNAMLGIDESEFICATQATYKLGISFENWGKVGDSYIHPFGSFGHAIQGIEFHHYWLHLRALGRAHHLDDYSMACTAAKQNRFAYPDADENSVLSTYAYAFHLDAGLYAGFLRKYAEAKQVCRCEGKVVGVNQDPDSGNIHSLVMESGAHIEGDLFIDCSGFAALLIEKTLRTGFDNWSHWLPCDSAIAVPCNRAGEARAYTRSIARNAGWQWNIPLQHRTGNGHVYCSRYVSDDEALNVLMTNLEGEPTAKPNFIKFTTGRRKHSWNKNCVAVGLASGFLEPLESTSIYLIQVAILKLLEFFPTQGAEDICRTEFNRVLEMEYLRVRDFLILHYHANQRSDGGFWDYCRHMPLPEELQRKINLFMDTAHIEQYDHGLFMTPSWIALYAGQGIFPREYDPRVGDIEHDKLLKYFDQMRNRIATAAQSMPNVMEALQQNTQTNSVIYPKSSLSLYGTLR
jgi:tryptophan 7-halogenase